MMKARLIKRDLSGPKEKIRPPPNDREISDTIWSWVRKFRVARDDRSRSELHRLKYPEKT